MAVSWLLDSNTLIAALKGEPHALLNRLASIAPNRLRLSSIVLAELLAGAEKSTDAARRKAELADLVEGMEAVPFDHDAAAVYMRGSGPHSKPKET